MDGVEQTPRNSKAVLYALLNLASVVTVVSRRCHHYHHWHTSLFSIILVIHSRHFLLLLTICSLPWSRTEQDVADKSKVSTMAFSYSWKRGYDDIFERMKHDTVMAYRYTYNPIYRLYTPIFNIHNQLQLIDGHNCRIQPSNGLSKICKLCQPALLLGTSQQLKGQWACSQYTCSQDSKFWTEGMILTYPSLEKTVKNRSQISRRLFGWERMMLTPAWVWMVKTTRPRAL